MSKADGIGTWVWNDTVNLTEADFPNVSFDFDFFSNGFNFDHIGSASFGDLSNYVLLAYGKFPSMDDTIPSYEYDVYSPIDFNDGDLIFAKGWQSQAYRTIDIKTAPPAEFLTILQANATYQGGAEPAPSGTTITYNGSTIATLSEGQTGTLSCASKKAVTDIAVAFGAAGTVTYNGKETAVEAGQTATLSCAGKLMKTDVVVKAGGSEPAKVTDLTGTTWVWNETLNLAKAQNLYDNTIRNIDFTSNNIEFNDLGFMTYMSDYVDCLIFNNTNTGESAFAYATFIEEPDTTKIGWQNEAYRTISITGGTDATNQTLIDYLYANATKQS